MRYYVQQRLLALLLYLNLIDLLRASWQRKGCWILTKIWNSGRLHDHYMFLYMYIHIYMYTHVYVCFAYIVKKDREKEREREKEICIAYIIQREKKTVRERYINIHIHVYIYIYIYVLHIMSTETCMYRYKDLDPEKQCDQHIQTTCDSWICDVIHASVEWGEVCGGYGHRPTQSVMYVPLHVNRFADSVLLIVQYRYLKSCSGDFYSPESDPPHEIMHYWFYYSIWLGFSFPPDRICQVEMIWAGPWLFYMIHRGGRVGSIKL